MVYLIMKDKLRCTSLLCYVGSAAISIGYCMLTSILYFLNG